MINNFDMLFYTLAFIVPGFITYTLITMFVPQKSEQAPNSVLRFLYFSCINYALWAWLVYLIMKNNYFKEHILRTAGLWFIIILISPIVTGLAIGLLYKYEVVRRLLQKLGINTIHTIPTAWDYKFSRLKTSVWILVTLKDGSTVSGLFNTNSFSSSDNTERDIYIENIYKITEEGHWVEVERNDGILIKGDQIKHIEFIKEEE